MIVLIVYGSLYPWHFAARELTHNPLWILFHAWAFSADRRFLADVLVNLALYVPVGMSAYLALEKYKSRWPRYVAPVVLGALLSASIEMVQIYTPSRECSAIDLTNNTIGSLFGVLFGLLFERLARPLRIRVPDRGALALLFCWVSALLFPLFPAMWLHEYGDKLLQLHAAPIVEPILTASAMACWFAAGRLMSAVHLKPLRLWLIASLLLVPAQFFVTGRQPQPAELTGAVVGVAMFMYFGTALDIGWFFLGVLVVRGLAPFTFTPFRGHFSFLPFGGFLETSWQAGLQLLLEKAFYYGAAIWLLRKSIGRLWRATATVCLVLAAIEVAQIWLPGRTAEITDPLLALLLGGGLWALTQSKKKGAGVSAHPDSLLPGPALPQPTR